MSTHTPGPWNRGYGNHVYRGAALAPGQQLIAVCQPINGWQDQLDEGFANARLIAAAPELLEVMKRAILLSKEHPDFKLWAMEPFLAAIAKAEGTA